MQQRTLYWIEGDGIGVDVWRAARPVIDGAVRAAYGDERCLVWEELLAGEKALKETGRLLPETTQNTLSTADLAIKGPLSTPVGTGFRSLNVTLRQVLDLYACIRPVRYFEGVVSPVRHPEKVNMVVFRENTEDVYAGIEYQANSMEARRLADFLRSEFGAEVDAASAIGIKPMSEYGCKRLVRAALKHAVEHNLPSVTLVHKGNIMKFTEGAFRQWGYEVAATEFSGRTQPEAELKSSPRDAGRVLVNDRIAEAMFQQILIRPEEYSVIATPNLNGDYISDALAAQVGGLGLAPGVNMSDTLAFFEATHGTAPAMAGQDRANPGSLILCGAMLLEHIGWNEAGQRIYNAIRKAIAAKRVTQDLARQMPDAVAIGTTAFGDYLCSLL
jgi:isocitrate dehydrogenase